MKRFTLFSLLLATTFALIAGCGGGDNGKKGNGGGAEEDFSRKEPPAEYKEKTMPETASAEKGKTLFEANCVTCHGANGDGDAPAGKALTPPSSDLTNPKLQDAISDQYIFWRISEGGAALGYTGMTPFKHLSEEDRWNLVAYIRTLHK